VKVWGCLTPQKQKNRRRAENDDLLWIKTGNFNYAAQFPESSNLAKFGEATQNLTLKELAERFLALKETEVANTSINTYRTIIKNVLAVAGSNILASAVNKEKLLEIRKELLTGHHLPKPQYETKEPWTLGGNGQQLHD
jgi:integrase